jgi:hypothetical protein
MGLIQNILGGGASELVKSIGEAIDRNVTNTGEKMALYNELQKILNEQEAQLTARHAADMASDSWLSKNVRPLTLIGLLVLYLLFALLDGLNILHLGAAYIDMLQQLCILVLTFYFGSRGLEKITYTVTKNKNGK